MHTAWHSAPFLSQSLAVLVISVGALRRPHAHAHQETPS